jgi:hypothetical protein
LDERPVKDRHCNLMASCPIAEMASFNVWAAANIRSYHLLVGDLLEAYLNTNQCVAEIPSVC